MGGGGQQVGRSISFNCFPPSRIFCQWPSADLCGTLQNIFALSLIHIQTLAAIAMALCRSVGGCAVAVSLSLLLTQWGWPPLPLH